MRRVLQAFGGVGHIQLWMVQGGQSMFGGRLRAHLDAYRHDIILADGRPRCRCDTCHVSAYLHAHNLDHSASVILDRRHCGAGQGRAEGNLGIAMEASMA